jgi:hypothetical protein
MENLPSEMINEILSRLDKPNLFQASNVCKLWRQQALTHVVIIYSKRQLKMAAEAGDWLSIIKLTYDEKWIDHGLEGACEGGHEDLAKLMLIKGARGYEYGLYGACKGGHKNLAELMIVRNADRVNMGLMNPNHVNRCLYAACKRGHKDLAKLMIAKGATYCSCGKSIDKH